MGVTFDSGALIGLERKTRRMRAVWARLQERGERITIPTVVIAECWYKPTDTMRQLVDLCEVEELSLATAEVAARARAECDWRASVVDAVVMASAASRGDDVYTGDFEDLSRLRDKYFPSIRLFSVSGPASAK